MPDQESGVLDILDLSVIDDGIKAIRQRITSPPGQALEVALPSRRNARGFVPSRSKAIQFAQAPGISEVSRNIKLEFLGECSGGPYYRWAEVASSETDLAIAVLPPGHALTQAEPPPLAARVHERRLVLFWAPGNEAIQFGFQVHGDDLGRVADEINDASPSRGKLPGTPGVTFIEPRSLLGLTLLIAVVIPIIVAAIIGYSTRLPPRPEIGPAPESTNVPVVLPEALHRFYEQSYALVVGINQYPAANWHDLSYATLDARGIAEFLETRGFKVTTLLDSRATKTAILTHLENDLARRLEPNDRVLFFFAGHGHTEVLGDQYWGYIVPFDGGNDSATYISMDKLRELSQKMGRAKHQLFILDSCFGGLISTKSVTFDPGRPTYLDDVMKRPARQVLTAGGRDQQVVDGYGPRGYGVLAGHLLEALEQGLADTNRDGYVTFSELSSYVVPRASNAYQTPGHTVLPGHGLGDFVFRAGGSRGAGEDAP